MSGPSLAKPVAVIDEAQDELRVADVAPPFPMEALPESVQEFVRVVASALACDLDFVAAGALAVVSAAIGSTRRVEAREGHTVYANLILVIVGEPGTRKSPALALAKAPLLRAQELAIREHRKRAEQADSDGKIPREPFPMMVVSDVTTEALAEVLDDNPRGVLYAVDEATGWVNSMNQYRSGGRGNDRQRWLSIYSNEPLIIRRTGRRTTVVSAPYVTLLGGVQPDVVGTLISGSHDGFADRLLFCYPRGLRFKVSHTGIPASVTDRWAQTILRLTKLGHEVDGTPVTMCLTTRALDAYEAWQAALFARAEAGGFPVFMEGAVAKAPGTVLKLALILENLAWATGLVGRGSAVDSQAVDDATALFAYFFEHAERLFRHHHTNPRDKRILQALSWILRREKAVVTAREVHQNGVASVRSTQEARELLVSAAALSGGACITSDGGRSMQVDRTLLRRHFNQAS